MLLTIHILNIVLPILYVLSFVFYFSDFINEQTSNAKRSRIVLSITISVHCFYLILRILEFNHAPITNKFEIFTLLACTIALAYHVLTRIADVKNTGAFIIFFSMFFQIGSSIYIFDAYKVDKVLENPVLGLHVLLAMLGQSGVIISAVYGVLFIMLYKKLKAKNYGLIFSKLPSLETLENLSFKSILIGYILFTIAMIIGAIWLPFAFPDFSHLDPKLIATAIVWIVYTAGISSKLIFKWYGKKVIAFSLIGFTVSLLSMMMSFIISNSFHSFN